MNGRIVSKHGFTIVELLIVIVVIAILAAISIVAYTGIQQRARDSHRKSDLAVIAKALQIYQVDNGPMFTASGCGSGGNGSGWFNYTYSSPGGNIAECLRSGGYLSELMDDPARTSSCVSNDTGCQRYMKYTCSQSGSVVTYVYANLETGTHNGDETDGTCSTGIDALYGMNYYVKF